MASAADGKVVVPDYYDYDSDSESESAQHGISTKLTTFGDLTGSRPPAPQEEPVLPLPSFQKGATDQKLRENIIELFGPGPTGNNTLSSLTNQNMAARAPAMYATYTQSFGLQHPVTLDHFSNNLNDYLKYRGGRKKQRRSVIKKRKSMSKKRKNGRKSNKKQRRR
jgi:hypothetical protein